MPSVMAAGLNYATSSQVLWASSDLDTCLPQLGHSLMLWHRRLCCTLRRSAGRMDTSAV